MVVIFCFSLYNFPILSPFASTSVILLELLTYSLVILDPVADLSPQDTTLLSDIVEVGPLPKLMRENEEIWHCFYIVTRFGLRMECSSISRLQVHLVIDLAIL